MTTAQQNGMEWQNVYRQDQRLIPTRHGGTLLESKAGVAEADGSL